MATQPDDLKDWELPQPSFWRSSIDFVLEVVKIVVISLAIIIPTRYFLIQPFYVKGASMEPNFHNHEYLIIDELSYRLREPKRGEIVVFKYPIETTQYFIKRVIGLPGEKVRIEDGKIYIVNEEHPEGALLDESDYLEGIFRTIGKKVYELGESEYFLMGDNRNSSLDSRNFGAVDRDLIVGRTWIRGWPLNKITLFSAQDTPLLETQ